MSKKILIADDYDDNRECMKFLLQSFGYEVLEAIDGLEAIECIKQQDPDLVLMDVSMPNMDGFTATRIIRESKEKSKLPIIAVTANGKQIYQQAIESGCNDLIAKPIDFNTLQPVIEQYLIS